MRSRFAVVPAFVSAAVVLGGVMPWRVTVSAEPPSAQGHPAGAGAIAPDTGGPARVSDSELRDLVERYTLDRFALQRRYPVESSPERYARFKKYFADWQARLAAVEFEPLGVEGRLDHLMLRSRIGYEQRLLERRQQWQQETTTLLPFAETIQALNDARMRMETLDPQKAAQTLDKLALQIDQTRRGVEATVGSMPARPSAPSTTTDNASGGSNGTNGGAGATLAAGPGGGGGGGGRGAGGGGRGAGGGGGAAAASANTAGGRGDTLPPRRRPSGPVTPIKTTKLIAFRAQDSLQSLSFALRGWFDFYQGYDPLFSWWADAPYKRVTQALDAYRRLLRERVVGIRPGEDEDIIGTPIGRDALVADLGSEFVAYTPEDLLTIGEREFAWCDAEMKKAAKDMGFGDDWKAAVEKVKTLHVPPGKQPDLIRDQAREAEDYVEKHNLITVPPLAKEIWRMQMMSPERQKVNPFFTGGEVISVSYPTDTMDQDDKLMSMRGNNIHFSRATVHHELIPGHHLQGFMTARYNSHREAFSTPFWGEGWSLYWEMLLWDLGFPATPENKVGMLFWRMHRAARIVFSLNFHLGKWTPEQCIDFLVDRVGHERANAEAEVRRSFNGSYPPLYQLAYMMGGLQFKALHAELVDSGKMSNRQFHDMIITGGRMPVEMVRARLTQTRLPRDYQANWKYAGQLSK
jgi:hypothetical protein